VIKTSKHVIGVTLRLVIEGFCSYHGIIFTIIRTMRRTLTTTVFVFWLIFSTPNISFARSGCCSYHDGVCGCSCCDGTPLSDTCAPYYPSCSKPKSSGVVDLIIIVGIMSFIFYSSGQL